MNGLDNITIPILMLTAEHEPITPAWNAETVLKSIPDELLVTFRQIADAGHFSFRSPFPESIRNPKFELRIVLIRSQYGIIYIK